MPDRVGLPEPDAVSMAFGAYLLEREIKKPGTVARIRARLESRTIRKNVVNLRSPQSPDSLLLTMGIAANWLVYIEALAKLEREA